MKDSINGLQAFIIRQYKKVKTLRRRVSPQEFATFLFFLVLSAFFWMLQSINEDSEAQYRVPLDYVNIPSDIRFAVAPVPYLEVSIKDKGASLLRYAFGKRLDPIRINVGRYLHNAGHGVFTVNHEDLISYVQNNLAPESEIVSIKPAPLEVSYEQLSAKRVPILFNSLVLPKQQYQLSNNIELYPDSITVFAPREVLDTLCFVRTHYEIYKEVSDTIYQQVSLEPVAGGQFEDKKINVFIPIEEYTQKTLSIPLHIYHLPDSLTLRTFPSVIQLTCIVDMKNFKDLHEDMFTLSVDYHETKDQDLLGVRVTSMPEFISNVRLYPDSVAYILELNEPISLPVYE